MNKLHISSNNANKIKYHDSEGNECSARFRVNDSGRILIGENRNYKEWEHIIRNIKDKLTKKAVLSKPSKASRIYEQIELLDFILGEKNDYTKHGIL